MALQRWVYRKSDGRFLYGGFYEPQPPLVGDPPAPDYVNYGVVEFSEGQRPTQTDVYDGNGGKRPMTPAEIAKFFPPPTRRLSRFEFLSTLTAAERIALRDRAVTDKTMADALEMLDLAAHVDCVPMHPMVSQMFDYVQAIGLMTAARAAEVKAQVAAAAK